jgi:AbiV family abortive infection protein
MEMPPYRPPLTEYQRWNLAGACLRNAMDLLRDSRTLLEAAALTRGAFLLVASLEEMLKARYCLRPQEGEWRTLVDWLPGSHD